MFFGVVLRLRGRSPAELTHVPRSPVRHFSAWLACQPFAYKMSNGVCQKIIGVCGARGTTASICQRWGVLIGEIKIYAPQWIIFSLQSLLRSAKEFSARFHIDWLCVRGFGNDGVMARVPVVSDSLR